LNQSKVLFWNTQQESMYSKSRTINWSYNSKQQ